MLLRDCRHIFALILSDLAFEWILSVCMVLALGAIFAPLFILLGLQEGIVGNMLDKLQRDPVSRLVTPRFPLSDPLDEHWLRSLKEKAAVVIDSPTSHLLLDVEGLEDPVNSVPTTGLDPLLVEKGIALPGEGLSLVLSKRLAGLSGKGAGDQLTLILERKTPALEQVPLGFRVAGVLPAEVTKDPKIWLPRRLFDAFYRWRKGEAIPELGLSGRGTLLTPEYDGILTLLENLPSDEDYTRMLAGRRIGFSHPPQAADHVGWVVPTDRFLRLWRPVGSRIQDEAFAPLVNRHRELGYPVEAVPYVDDLEVDLRTADATERLTLTILPDTPEAGETGIGDGIVPVWVAWEDVLTADSDIDGQLVPETEGVQLQRLEGFREGASAEMVFAIGAKGGEIRIPVRILGSQSVTPGFAAVPRALAGKMNAARAQEAAFDPASGELTPLSNGIRFFRAYAPSIDALEGLVVFIQAEGTKIGSDALREPVSHLAEVRNIRELAGYMKQLYLLIVVVAGVSGFFAIAASVYAGVERKRRDLAYLQLLGVHPGALFLFPYLKSLALVAGGLLFALGAYALVGHFADQLLADALGDSASLTRLTMEDIAMLVAVILGSASLASLLAATAVTRIEPGEYIRE